MVVTTSLYYSVAILELKYRGTKVLFDDQNTKFSISDTHRFCSLLLIKYGLKSHYSATATVKNTQFNTTNIFY